MFGIAYPLTSFPSGGVFSDIPNYYYEYQYEYNKRVKEEESKRARDFENRFTNRFENFDPFFNMGEREFPASFEEVEPEDQIDYPYSVFGLKRSASDEDMKKAYHKAVRETHPDKTGCDSEDAFREVQEAYEFYKMYEV